MEIIFTIALFLIILSILVLVHEAGHFFAARIFRVHVEEFGLGFPPRAKGWKRGNMIYSLNWLPLGGFVKLKGEQGDSAADKDSFAHKPVWQRVIILLSGVAMNVLLTIVLLTGGFFIGMPQIVDTEDDFGQTGRAAQIQIINVLPSSPAEQAGIQPGDSVDTIDGQSFERIGDFQKYVRDHTGQQLVLLLKRGDRTVEKTIIPQSVRPGEPGMIGVGLAKTAIVSYPLPQAFVMAVKTTLALAVGIVSMLGAAFSQFAFDGFVGPVGIATYTATAAQLGFAYIINLMAQLSMSLAVINVLPIPALDGGRVLFTLVEKVRRRSLRPALENAIHLIGFFTLILLLLAVTIRDIIRLIPS